MMETMKLRMCYKWENEREKEKMMIKILLNSSQ